MKLIIQFQKGQYSPIKDEFKSLFSSVFKWDRYKGWRGKTGFVEATEEMKTGNPITFKVECPQDIYNKLKSFCDLYFIQCIDVQDLNPYTTPQLLPTEVISPEPKVVEDYIKSPPDYPWMCPEYNYTLWNYHKEQLLNEWNPDFKVIWS